MKKKENMKRNIRQEGKKKDKRRMKNSKMLNSFANIAKLYLTIINIYSIIIIQINIKKK